MSNPYAPPDPNKPRPPVRPGPARGQRPQGSPPPWQRPDPASQEPPDPKDVARVTGKVTRFGLLMILSMIAVQLPLPYQAIAPVVVAYTIYKGVQAFREGRRINLRGILMPLLAGGIALSAMIGFSSITSLALWDVQQERQDCLAGALTVQAQQECEQDYQSELTRRLNPGEQGSG